MKTIFKKVIIFKLKVLTKLYLKLNRIEVIAITGSAGKTTTKVALAKLLQDIDIYVPEKNYNTEIGLPLAVFDESVPENIVSFKAWVKLILRVLSKVTKKAPYKKIVLEMSADHPGDIKYLTKIAKPTIGIVTSILPVHTLEFKTVENIAREKGFLVEALPKKGTAILNADNKYVRLMAERTRAKVILVGEDRKADIRYQNVVFKPSGIVFDLFVRGQKYKVRTKIVAPQLLTSLLSAFAVGLLFNLEVRDLLDGLESFLPEKGRMNLISGINESLIIDDSYNANPSSVKAALSVLSGFPGKKIAVLGSMKELGGLEKSGHESVIAEAIRVADEVYLVGKEIRESSRQKGKRLNKKIVKIFNNFSEAADYLKDVTEKDSVILVKGSQSMYMEEVTKAIMKRPEEANEILVRQSKMWEDKKRETKEE